MATLPLTSHRLMQLPQTETLDVTIALAEREYTLNVPCNVGSRVPPKFLEFSEICARFKHRTRDPIVSVEVKKFDLPRRRSSPPFRARILKDAEEDAESYLLIYLI